MKLEVEFDNHDGDTDQYFTLRASDLVLDAGVHGTLVPISMFDGRHATYNLPDGMTEDDLVEALEKCSWCYTQISDVGPEGPGL